MGVKVFHGTLSINIVNVYSRFDNEVHDLSKVGQLILGPSLILEDLNLQHPLFGAPSSSQLSERFLDCLENSPYCFLNSWSPTHVVPSGVCFLIDISL